MKTARKALKLTQNAVAGLAKLSLTTVKRFEWGENVGFAAVVEIGDVLGGSLRFEPVDAPAVVGAVPVVTVGTTVGQASTLAGVDPALQSSTAYTTLRSRFEDGERFDAMVAVFVGVPRETLSHALETLAARPGLPSSKAIRELING